MNWLQRFRTRKATKDQTVTLELNPKEWAEIQEWAKGHDWTPQYMITRWLQDRLHGTGRIGN